jgi:hypothetical protein
MKVGKGALLCAVPTTTVCTAAKVVGTAREGAPLPTLIWGQLSRGHPAVRYARTLPARRRAEPCVSQRAAALARSQDWLPSYADHCITSYPVGSLARTQIPHASGEEATRNGTHLQERLLCWPKGGTVTIHPVSGATRVARGELKRLSILLHVHHVHLTP